jgi:branched-chain amino acid aminotransferase
MLGYGIVLHLDSVTHTFVEEFSTSGFLGHKIAEDGRHVLVVPATDNAIQSTTSDSLVALAEREGWIIEKAKVSSNTCRAPGLQRQRH